MLVVEFRDSGLFDLGRGPGGLNAGHLPRKGAFGQGGSGWSGSTGSDSTGSDRRLNRLGQELLLLLGLRDGLVLFGLRPSEHVGFAVGAGRWCPRRRSI